MRKLGARIGWGRLAGLILLVLLLGLRWLDPTPVKIVRNLAFDFYQRLKPRDYGKLPVAILDIDEASLKKHGQWPWPRTKIAELVTTVTKMGAPAIAFDMIFAEPDRLSPALVAQDNEALSEEIRQSLRQLPSNDDVFAQALKQSRVVVGQTSIRNTVADNAEKVETREVPHAMLGPDARPFLKRFPDIIHNLPEIEAAANGHGVFTIEPDLDGVFRRFPLIMIIQEKLKLFLSPELLRVATGGNAIAIKSDNAGITSLVVGGQQIRTDRNGAVWPWFTNIKPERYVSAGAVLDGTIPQNRLRGHLVLVGTSVVGLEDIRPTPMGISMPGVEIHAQIIENILTGKMLIRTNYAHIIELAAILLLGLLIILLVPMLNAFWSVVCGGVVVFSYVGGSFLYFNQERLLIDPTFPVIAITLIFMLMASVNYFVEERSRNKIKGAFGQYVSPDLVDRLAAKPEALALGGEMRELSVLFSDVRGFTGISESYRHNPQGLTELMNRFLTVLSKPILDHKGTIDKFMGDAVMAFWNAPLDADDHAYKACLASIEMLDQVEFLNRRMMQQRDADIAEHGEERGTYHNIKVGIGVNTGDCVVGNMGSDIRFDYTALGDTVNIASRLEGQSKPYGIGIVIGSKTASQVEGRLALFEIDQIRVKGKNEPEQVFGLFGNEELLSNPQFAEMSNLNASMIAAYRKQDWETAFAALEVMRELERETSLGIDDYLFLYETRIAEFEANPPGRSWDGVYNADSK